MFMLIYCLGTDDTVLATNCSPDIELLAIKVCSFYLPLEFSLIFVTVIYMQSQVDKTKTLDYLYFTVNGLEKKHPFIVVGDFNRYNMRKVLLKYVNMKLKDSFKFLAWPAFGEGDHISILLLPAYRQCLKLEKAAVRPIHKCSVISRLQDYFESTDREMFQNSAGIDIDAYTDSVISYINKCTEDILTTVYVWAFPIQKPWPLLLTLVTS